MAGAQTYPSKNKKRREEGEKKESRREGEKKEKESRREGGLALLWCGAGHPGIPGNKFLFLFSAICFCFRFGTWCGCKITRFFSFLFLFFFFFLFFLFFFFSFLYLDDCFFSLPSLLSFFSFLSVGFRLASFFFGLSLSPLPSTLSPLPSTLCARLFILYYIIINFCLYYNERNRANPHAGDKAICNF